MIKLVQLVWKAEKARTTGLPHEIQELDLSRVGTDNKTFASKAAKATSTFKQPLHIQGTKQQKWDKVAGVKSDCCQNLIGQNVRLFKRMQNNIAERNPELKLVFLHYKREVFCKSVLKLCQQHFN